MFGLKLRVCETMSISQTEKYKTYLQSPRWLEFSTDAKMATGGRCQGCDRETWNLQVHHLTYERLGNERATDVWVVCGPCHLKFHPHHKKRVNKIRKKQGKSKIRGRLGSKPERRKGGRKKTKPPRPKPWSEAERQAITEAANRKLGNPRPATKDFRSTLLG